MVMILLMGCDMRNIIDPTIEIPNDNGKGDPVPFVNGKREIHRVYTPILSPLLNKDGFFGIVLLSDGTVWSWGYNRHGQLGTGDRNDRNYFAPVVKKPEEGTHTYDEPLANIVDIAVGGYSVLALSQNNELYGWGKDHSTMADLLFVPKVNITSIARGNGFSLLLSEEGKVYAWGKNSSGQLGAGDYIERELPYEITGLRSETIVSIHAGSSFALARTEDGRLYAWGYNGRGVVEDRSVVTHPYPVQIMWDDPATDDESIHPLSGVKELDVGSNFVVALLDTGMVVGWGRNDLGQLDEQGDSILWYPVPLVEDRSIQNLAAGEDYFFVLRGDNKLQSWKNRHDADSGYVLGIPDPIIDFKTGGFSTLILTEKRELYILSGDFAEIVEKIPLHF